MVERGLVMLQKQQDKRGAMLECDRGEGEMQPSGEGRRKKKKKWVPLFMLIS